MKKSFILTTLLALALNIGADVPESYLTSAEGQSGLTLKATLHTIISAGHTVLSYTPGVWNAYEYTDLKSDGTVWDMYSDVPGGTPSYTYTYSSDQCGNYSGEGSCYNREHSFPKSWFGDVSPMSTDIIHVVPSDGYVNGKRGNYPYGEVDSPTWTSTNGCKVGSCVTDGYTGTVFEPIDEYKGDFARIYFYMATRYYGEDSNWPGSAMVDGAEPEDWALAMLKRWHAADPVSQKEIDRNNGVYDQQGNCNPFVIHPEYVDSIWNGDLTPAPVDTVIVDPISGGFNLTFDSDMESCTAYQVSGSTSWTQSSYGDNGYLYINTYDEGSNESWVVTPSVNLDELSNVNFSFEVSSYNASITIADCGEGQFEVYYSTTFTGGSIDETEWTRLTSVDDVMLGERWDFTPVDIDMTSISGDNVTFAFAHKCTTDGTTWEVDNVILSGEIIPIIEPIVPVSGLNLTFDSDMDSCTAYQISGSTSWTQSAYGENGYLYINTYDQGSNESWAVTPSVNLEEIPNASFSFEVSSYNASITIADCGEGQFEVYYSTTFTGGAIDETEWTRFTSVDDVMLGARWDFTPVDIDMSSISGDNVTFAFAHKCTSDGTTWEVDNVILSSESSSSLDETSQLEFSIYPNPAKESITITKAADQVSIVSLSGQTLMTVNSVEAMQSINISMLTQGVYFVKSSQGNQVGVLKLVKE